MISGKGILKNIREFEKKVERAIEDRKKADEKLTRLTSAQRKNHVLSKRLPSESIAHNAGIQLYILLAQWNMNTQKNKFK